MMVVRGFEVLDLWVFDLAETDMTVIGAEDVLKAFHEANEVFAVELSSENSAIS